MMSQLKILLEKSSAEEEIELIEATKERKKRGLQARLDYARSLYHKRLDVLYESDLKARKLEKLGVSRARIDEAKESSNLGQSFWWWN